MNSHEEADELGLISISEGDDDERHVVVYKSGYEPREDVQVSTSTSIDTDEVFFLLLSYFISLNVYIARLLLEKLKRSETQLKGLRP